MYCPVIDPITSMDTPTHSAATNVIIIPAFAMSLMEKYPAEYGITLVGVSVTSINASDEVKAAGAVMSHGFRFRSAASAISKGMMIVPVTVLLEKAM